jgi:hypothetical protein
VIGDPHLRFYAGHPLHAPGGEPIGTLCVLDTEPHTLSEAQRGLLRDLAFWVQTELANDAELDHAAVIQSALRPHTHPVVPGYTIAGGAVSRGRLAGDFYDLGLHRGALRITLADAMGKGTGPALIAASVRASLRTAPDRSLQEAIADADRLLEEDLADTAMFVTAVHAELQPDTGELEVIDAGHSLASTGRGSTCARRACHWAWAWDCSRPRSASRASAASNRATRSSAAATGCSMCSTWTTRSRTSTAC